AIVGQQLGLVADADLAHLDARLVGAGQVAHQLAEIDALLGQEVKDDALAAKEVLHVHQLHLEPALADKALTDRQFLDLGDLQALQCAPVFLGHAAHNPAVSWFGEQLYGPDAGLTQHLADFEAALSTQHHLLGAVVDLALTRLELAEEAHGAV